MRKDKQLPAGRTGGSACSALRTAYNDCFNRWYSDKFLKGQWDKEECISEWEAYRACVMKHMEDKNLSRLLKVEAMYSRQDDPVCPLHNEEGSLDVFLCKHGPLLTVIFNLDAFESWK